MAELGQHFNINYNAAKSKPQCIFQGQFYRITILSDVLVRLNLMMKVNLKIDQLNLLRIEIFLFHK